MPRLMDAACGQRARRCAGGEPEGGVATTGGAQRSQDGPVVFATWQRAFFAFR
jgi:hypothetical protein